MLIAHSFVTEYQFKEHSLSFLYHIQADSYYTYKKVYSLYILKILEKHFWKDVFGSFLLIFNWWYSWILMVQIILLIN